MEARSWRRVWHRTCMRCRARSRSPATSPSQAPPAWPAWTCQAWPTPKPPSRSCMARIARTIAFIETLTPGQIDGSEDKTITLQFPGREIAFEGQHFLLGFSLPNLFFHVHHRLRHPAPRRRATGQDGFHRQPLTRSANSKVKTGVLGGMAHPPQCFPWSDRDAGAGPPHFPAPGQAAIAPPGPVRTATAGPGGDQPLRKVPSCALR